MKWMTTEKLVPNSLPISTPKKMFPMMTRKDAFSVEAWTGKPRRQCSISTNKIRERRRYVLLVNVVFGWVLTACLA